MSKASKRKVRRKIRDIHSKKKLSEQTKRSRISGAKGGKSR